MLGVSHDASVREIRRADRRLAREHHPDRNAEPDGPERFRMVAEACAMTIVRPAGLTDGDQITIPVPEGWAVLNVRVTTVRKT